MILFLDKPEGMTSQKAVFLVRKAAGKRLKIGHTGTLDPMCTGLLPLLTGHDTRLIPFLPSEKAYLAEIRLGIRTDTQDVTGQVLETKEPASESALLSAFSHFVGEIEQVPPMYSAIQKDGVRLYDLARKGIEVDRDARKIRIDTIDYRGKTGEDTYSFYVACSSGTYIRTLCDDIGRFLGCGACMQSLRRVKSNGFTIDLAQPLDALQEHGEKGTLSAVAMTAEQAFSDAPSVAVPPEAVTYMCNGGSIYAGRMSGYVTPGILHRAYGPDGTFLGLCRLLDDSAEVKMVWTSRDDRESGGN